MAYLFIVHTLLSMLVVMEVSESVNEGHPVENYRKHLPIFIIIVFVFFFKLMIGSDEVWEMD
jgi:hypothetical protein